MSRGANEKFFFLSKKNLAFSKPSLSRLRFSAGLDPSLTKIAVGLGSSSAGGAKYQEKAEIGLTK